MGLPAWGNACSSYTSAATGFMIPIATATAAGFSCEVNQLTFSNIQVGTTTATVFGFLIYDKNGESGLTLNYASTATLGHVTDVAWLMDVTAAAGTLIHDVFAELTGSITVLSGQAVMGENVLEQGTNKFLAHLDLSLPAPPGLAADTKFFTPVAGVSVSKDQQNTVFAGADGSVATSLLTNAFSVVPGPIAGAGLPGLVVACGGLLGLARRRRQKIA